VALKSTKTLKAYAGNNDLMSEKHPSVGEILDELQSYVTRIVRTAVAATYTATTDDVYIGVTSTAAARTINLPAAAVCGSGKRYVIKDESGAANTNNITVDPNASETIDGATARVISTAYGSVTVVCNGANWFTT